MNPYKRPHFFSFSGWMTVGEFWSSFFTSVMYWFAMTILFCIVLCITVPGEVEELAQYAKWICAGCGLFWSARIAALSRRRLRDGGFTAKSYLWLLLPGIGLVIFIVRRLCARSAD